MLKITKQHFLDALEKAGLSAEHAEVAYTVFGNVIGQAIHDGNSVVLRNVLTLKAVHEPPRVYRDNLYHKTVHKPARIAYRLKISEKLSEKMVPQPPADE